MIKEITIIDKIKKNGNSRAINLDASTRRAFNLDENKTYKFRIIAEEVEMSEEEIKIIKLEQELAELKNKFSNKTNVASET